MTIHVGSIIKLKPEVFGDETKVVNDKAYGYCRYLGFMRLLHFKVVAIDEDFLEARIANIQALQPLYPNEKIELVEGEDTMYIRIADAMPAVVKTTLQYTIIEPPPFVVDKELVARLFKERRLLKLAGKAKEHPDCMANWQQIKQARGDFNKPLPTDLVTVAVKNGRFKFSIPRGELPIDAASKERFERKIISLIQSARSNRKYIKLEIHAIMGQLISKQGGVYLNKGELLATYERGLMALIDKDKVPPAGSKDTYVGIEIEFLYRAESYDLMRKLFVKQKLQRNVQLTDDGSVKPCHNNRDYAGAELRVLATTDTMEDVLRRIELVLSHPRIDAYVNRSCGLHIHLDQRHRDAAKVFKNFVRIQNILRGSQPYGRINNRHCFANISDDIHTMTHAGLDPNNALNRRGELVKTKYAVVNGLPALGDMKTIEIRVHEGTVNCRNIFLWCQFLNAIADYKGVIDKNNTLTLAADLNKIIKNIPVDSIGYVDRRINRFRSLMEVS